MSSTSRDGSIHVVASPIPGRGICVTCGNGLWGEPPCEHKRSRMSCGCSRFCGDDGDVDGPGICKGLNRPPDPPLVEIVLVPR